MFDKKAHGAQAMRPFIHSGITITARDVAVDGKGRSNSHCCCATPQKPAKAGTPNDSAHSLQGSESRLQPVGTQNEKCCQATLPLGRGHLFASCHGGRPNLERYESPSTLAEG